MSAELKDAIRAAGGIVHSDGNIFFSNAEQFEKAAAWNRRPPASSERVALIEELEVAAGRITQYSNSPLDGLLQAAADALRAGCGHEWKPIDAAPKWTPGTEREFILLWCQKAYNVEHIKVGYVEAGGAVYSMYEATGEIGSEPQRYATHWMPRPVAPAPRPDAPTSQINKPVSELGVQKGDDHG